MLRHFFAHSVELWNIPWQAWTRSEGRHHRFNSIKISAICLIFVGMMHNNMEQIAIQNCYAGPFFARLTELWNFRYKLGPTPRDDIAALILSIFLRVPRNFGIFHDRLGPGRWIEEITLRPEIWWHDADHEADHCMKCPHSANVRIFWFQPAEGAVVLRTSCCRWYYAMWESYYHTENCKNSNAGR